LRLTPSRFNHGLNVQGIAVTRSWRNFVFGWVPAIALLACGSIANAVPPASVPVQPQHQYWPFVGFLGPFMILGGSVLAALILVFSIIIRKEAALMSFADICVRRLEGSRVGLFFWGVAETIAILFVGTALLHVPGIRLLGGLLLAAGALLGGFSVAVTAIFVGRKCTGDLTSDAGQISAGIAVLAAASAVPVIGWLVGMVLCMSSLGASTETLITRRVQAVETE
jgi:hypothetical protein